MSRILCPVLVGREAELARLNEVVQAAQRGRGGVATVIGPAGVGKSRLLAEVAGEARRTGSTVLTGRCLPSASSDPYRPVSEALLALSPQAVRAVVDSLGGLAAALGAVAPTLAPGEVAVKPESPVVLSEALLRALHVAGGIGGSLLVIEDIQWSDAETLHAIEYLAHHVTTSRVALLCSMRGDAPPLALAATVRLEAEHVMDAVRLAPLTTADAVTMAARTLDTDVLAEEIGAYLRDAAEGLPFLIEELLATAIASGALTRDEGSWHMSAPQRLVVPESFAVSVRERLHAMGPQERRVLGAGALLGRAFDWELAARSAGCSADVAKRALTQALNLQLLAVEDRSYYFRHALTREAVIDELLPHERTELAAACLAVVATRTHDDPADLHVAAELAVTANQPQLAATLLLQAGRRALIRGALESAAGTLERARKLGTHDQDLLADILEAQAEVATAAGDMARARELVASLVDALGRISAPPDRSAQAHLMLARCAVTAAHFGVAHEELERAGSLAQSAGDRALAARVASVAAQLAAGEGKADAAEALARDAAAAAEASAQPEIVCEALEVVSRCARTRDLSEAKSTGERMLLVAERAGLPYWRMRALYQIGVVEMFASYDFDTLLRARAEAERQGAVATATVLDLEISAALDAQHRIEEARARCAQCIDMASALELHVVEGIAHAFVAIIEAERGARRLMEAAIARACKAAGEDPEVLGALWGDARAVASLATEDRVRARDELHRAVEVYENAPHSVVPRLGLALLTVVDAVDGHDPDFGRPAGVTLLNAQGAGYVAYAEAVVLGRRGRGAEAAVAAQRGDQHLARCPWYRNLMRRLVAEAALADGWGEPLAWLTEAAAFFDEAGNERIAAACRTLMRRAGGKVGRPTRDAMALPATLRAAGVTPREAEVLAQLGQGLSNRAIAERLFLSERTVEQHVAALKQKLEARSRAQLAIQAASAFSPPG